VTGSYRVPCFTLNMFKSNLVIHSINTRHCSDLYLPSVHLSKVQKAVYHSGIKVFNCLLPRIKSLSSDITKFKSASKRFLLEGSFYTIQEYFDWNLLSNPSTGNLPVLNDCWYCNFNNKIIHLLYFFYCLLNLYVYIFDNTYILPLSKFYW
jgi:hypothetical protein